MNTRNVLLVPITLTSLFSLALACSTEDSKDEKEQTSTGDAGPDADDDTDNTKKKANKKKAKTDSKDAGDQGAESDDDDADDADDDDADDDDADDDDADDDDADDDDADDDDATSAGCPLSEEDFAIAGTTDGTLYKYTTNPTVVATSDTHLMVTMGDTERWRLTIPNTPGSYTCGSVAGETAIELLRAPAFPTTFGKKGVCTIEVARIEGFITGSFEATLVSTDEMSTFPASGCFNVPNGGTLSSGGDTALPDGPGATINVTKGNNLVETGTSGALEDRGVGDQRAMEQMFGNFAGQIGTPPVAAGVNFLGLPYAPGTFRCGEQPVVDGQALYAEVSLAVSVGTAYRADSAGGSCEIVVTGGDPDFEATYSGTFISGDTSIDAEGRMRFANPKAM